MKSRRWGLAVLLVLGGSALWLLLSGPRHLLGMDTGNVGMALLMIVTWVSLYRIARTSGDEVDGAISPAEWQAWVGLAFMLAAVAYFLVNAEAFQQGPSWANQRVARNLVLMLVAWAVLSSVMRARWKGKILHDERDTEIEKQAAGWGRGALMACVAGIAVLLGFSPAAKLQWATHFAVANLLVFALMWGWLCECAATAILYRRDRR